MWALGLKSIEIGSMVIRKLGLCLVAEEERAMKALLTVCPGWEVDLTRSVGDEVCRPSKQLLEDKHAKSVERSVL